MTSYVTPKKGVEFICYVGLFSQANTKILQANPTLASGDAKVSIDGGAFANLATLPAVTPASGKSVKVTLSTSEMNGDNITVVLSDASGDEWCDLVVNIQTSARQIDDLAFPTTSGRSIDVSATGEVDADVVAISGDSAAADNLEAWMDSCHAGTAQAGAAATITLTAGAPSVNLAGSVICLSGGTGARQARVIVGYDTGTKVANIYPNWGTNPDNTTTYIVLTGLGPSDIESILRDSAPTDGLWTAMMQYNSNNYFSANVVAIENTALANLFDTDSGETYGSAVAGSPVKEIVDNVVSGLPTAAANADAVWDEARSGHTTAGTYGESFLGVVNGQAATGTLSTTQMTTNLTEATNDHYNGRIVVFITGDLAGQATDITDYDGSTKMITMTALTEAPISGNRFVIV